MVTTRSRLHGFWQFPEMMLVTSRVRRQLAADPTVVRWASVVAGPCEFWTITVWKTRHDMSEFMRSGAHEEIMWLFSRLLRSFWLMRWRPGPAEVGAWKGLAFSRPEVVEHVTAPRDDRLSQALENLPRLRAATGANGAACYEATAFARRRKAEVGDARGAIVYLKTPRHQLVSGWRAMRRLRVEARCSQGFVRAALGVGHLGEIYLLAVWGNRQGAQRLLESQVLEGLAGRFECWASEWVPENEFGNWDGARLRRMRKRQVIRVPQGAMAAADSDDRGRRASARQDSEQPAGRPRAPDGSLDHPGGQPPAPTPETAL